MTAGILIKLGGSLLTEKSRPETPRTEVIARLAAEIARAAARGPERLILGHGSGSFGHVAASRSRLAGGLTSADQLPGISATQQSAAALHRLVVEALAAAGATPYSIAPSSCVVTAGGRPAAFADEPLLLALERGLLPVLYGDVVLDRQQGVAICSTETILELLARTLPARGVPVSRAIWLGETDGLYDEAGRTIPRVSAATFQEAARGIGAPAGTDVTGGMRHRVEAALALAGLGIPSLLANGLTPGLLERALRGEAVPGTEVV
ncbi:MAG TPA: isopentenyl phosphate kinase [Thermoanaerobaculia bacterium]|nr:isopentenyl phosphate kinase [Thermoanaerobaculia bacterium]